MVATWAALEALPLVEPSARVGWRLRRLIWWDAVREVLASREGWRQAVLAGGLGVVLSVLLALLVPYDTMVAVCRDVVAAALPPPSAYAVAGLVYGLAPMAIGAALRARRAPRAGAVGALEASVAFLLVLVPYVVVRCSEFGPTLLAGFATGVTIGAILGALTGRWLVERRA